MLAECVYASKFVTSKQSKDLVEIICGLLSEHQAVKLKKEIFVLDRVKTNNKNILANFACIEDAMSVSIDGVPHTPVKIRFKYLQYQMGMLDQQIERRKGNWYTVSPFKLMISEGNYYLMAVNEKGKLINYRLDRMRNIQPTGEPREGEEIFAEVDLRTYPQRVFNMYRGKEEQVVIRFIPPLLDTFVERFGTKGISPCGKDHLMIRTSFPRNPMPYLRILFLEKPRARSSVSYFLSSICCLARLAVSSRDLSPSFSLKTSNSKMHASGPSSRSSGSRQTSYRPNPPSRLYVSR